MKMKRVIIAAGLVFSMAGLELVHADSILSDDFNSYADGNLVGQGGWLQTASTATNPIQVSSGVISLGSSGGQDVYNPFASVLNLADFSSLTVTMDLTVTSAATGDYFFHLGTTSGGTSGFYDKLFVEQGTTGYLLGVSGISTSTGMTYGTTELDLGSTYAISLTWNMVEGAANDTFDLSVGGSAYVSGAFLASDTEPTVIAEANFRQGSSGKSAALSVDNFSVTTTAAVPEPATVALIALGFGVAMWGVRRRRIGA